MIYVGFFTGLSYSSLFIYTKEVVCTFLLVYDDDLLSTCNNSSFLNQFMTELSTKFSLNNLGFHIISWHITYSNKNCFFFHNMVTLENYYISLICLELNQQQLHGV